jgi:DNA-binding HxlR family transcriptional regulator
MTHFYDTKLILFNAKSIMSNFVVTSNLVVTMTNKKSNTDPPACVRDILALQDSIDLLGGKWRLRILHYLLVRQGSMNTFKKIEKDMVGISAKVLSKELKTLEVNLLISREVMDTKPITVQYSIIAYGAEVKSVLSSLVNWGQRHRKHLFQATSTI